MQHKPTQAPTQVPAKRDRGVRDTGARHKQGYPTTLFFDAQGQLSSVRVGELSRATLAQKLVQIAPGTR